MLLSTYQNAQAFLLKVQSTLEKQEACNSLMLGICFRLCNFPERTTTPPYLVTVEDEHQLLFAACMTPPYNLVLAFIAVDDHAAVELVVRQLLKDQLRVPGVLGPAPTAEAFAQIWEKLTGKPYREGVRQRVFELCQVIPPSPVPGALRLATGEDLELVTRWTAAFAQEALHEEEPVRAHQEARRRIGDREIYLWELPDRQVVTMAAKTRPISNGISVSLVYTPPENRERGYASNCVAALSQLLLASGWKWCSLFTDLSNPTSNSIYQKIGYRPVCDFNEYLFHDVCKAIWK